MLTGFPNDTKLLCSDEVKEKNQKLCAAVDYSNGRDMSVVTLFRVDTKRAHLLTSRATSNTLKAFFTVREAAMYCYPNRHVVWLALYHGSERVRKKNTHRIVKWLEAGCKKC